MLARLIGSLVYHLDINRGVTFEAASSLAALRRIKRRGLDVRSVIDIGASNGQWSEQAMRIYPDAQYLLMEAQPIHSFALDHFVKRHPNAQYVLKAAGENPGTIYFDAGDAFAGQAFLDMIRPDLIPLPVTTLDAEIASRKLEPPFLIKFDVHGFEVPILAGAKETLKTTSLIVMECYNFKIAPTSLLFHDMCRFLQELGFRVIDLSEPLWRLQDRALWQIDFFFVPENRPEFQSSNYA